MNRDRGAVTDTLTGGPSSAPVADEWAINLTLGRVGGAALWALGIAVLFFYLSVYVAHVANLAAYPYDLDQGEAYDVNSGWLLAQGMPIYTDNADFLLTPAGPDRDADRADPGGRPPALGWSGAERDAGDRRRGQVEDG
jgi:hypothetical protein